MLLFSSGYSLTMKFKLIYLLFSLIIFIACNRPVTGSKPAKRNVAAEISERQFIDGMKDYITDHYPEGLSKFEQSYKSYPENSAASYMMAKIYLSQDRLKEAELYAEKAQKLDEKNKYYFLLLAHVYEKEQNYNEAIKVYKKLIETVSGTEDYYYELAVIYLRNKDMDNALKTYTKIDEVFGKSLEVTRQKQQLYLKMNKTQDAIDEGYSLINAFPDETEYKLMQAEFLYTVNKSKEAQQLLDTVLKINPDNAYARYILANIYKSQGNTEKAFDQLGYIFKNPDMDLEIKLDILKELALQSHTTEDKMRLLHFTEDLEKAHPDDSHAMEAHGDALLRVGNLNEALNKYLEAKKNDNNNYSLWTHILTLDMDMGKADSLVRHSDEALEVFPNQASLWFYNGLGYLIKKQYEEATEALEQGKKLAMSDKQLLVEFDLELGDAYNSLKEYNKSDAAFEEVLKQDSTNDHALNNYSYFLSLRKDKLDRAKEMSGKLVQKYPGNASYLDTYAWVLYMMNDLTGAKKYIEMAVMGSNNGTIIEHYGDVLYKLGDKDQALEQWKKAKELGDTSEFIDKKIAEKKLYE